jgi:hypothetical protein
LSSEIVPTEWPRSFRSEPPWDHSQLPDGAAAYLRRDNPNLIALELRYKAFDTDVTEPALWTPNHLRSGDLLYFRGDNAWLWQTRGWNANALGYALTFYYLKSLDHLSLLNKLVEDNCFGAFTFQVADHVVSRDLLDSIAEIYFLDRHLHISSRTGLRVLDIGAGYGRLAHRMVTALPGVDAFICTDAIAASTFVSDYYLRFRGIAKTRVIPLDEIEGSLSGQSIDFAINIHSFSECRAAAIEWWARLLSKLCVKYLMIAPNRLKNEGEHLLTNNGEDFRPVFQRNGYETIVKEPKYLDPVVQKYGLQPTWYHLLELQR